MALKRAEDAGIFAGTRLHKWTVERAMKGDMSEYYATGCARYGAGNVLAFR